MVQKKVNPMIYMGVAGCIGLLMLLVGKTQPLIWALGSLILPPLSLAAFCGLPRLQGDAWCIAFMGVCLLSPGGAGQGALVFMLWFGGAYIAAQFLRKSPDLYPVLFYGGSLYGGLTCFSVLWTVREAVGVWDVRYLFTRTEALFLSLFDKLGAELVRFTELPGETQEYFKMLLPGFSVERTEKTLELLRGQTESLAYAVLGIALTAVALLFFYTVKSGEGISVRSARPVRSLPLWMLSVPRPVTVAYMLSCLVGMFVGGTFYFAFHLALQLFGYLFILVGVGAVDEKLKKKSHALRMFVKLALVAVSVLGQLFGAGLVGMLLTVVGMVTSLRRTVIVKKIGGDKDE